MKKAHLVPAVREDLDDRREKWTLAVREPVPKAGWVREIREALGMSSRQLAKRVGVSAQAIVALEKSEINGTVRLASLRKVARAMSCHLVYALVPKQPLRKTLRERAAAMITPEVMLTLHKNNIKLPSPVIIQMINKRVAQLRILDKPGKLWNEIEIPPEYEELLTARLKRQRQRRAAKNKKPMLSEAEIVELPPHVQELARMGKVEM